MSPAPGWCQISGYPIVPAPPARLLPPVVADGPFLFEPVEPQFAGLPTTNRGPVPVVCPRPAEGCREDPFRNATCGGLVMTCFPQSLIWDPPLAARREPRFTLVPTTLSNAYTHNTLDVNIGATAGLSRFDREGNPLRVQLDMFGVVVSRISEYNYLVASDYRAGLPLTFELEAWHGKVSYEHSSDHVGDETILRTGRQRIDFTKDELVLGLGRWLYGHRLRLYGDGAWAFFQNIPDDPSPFRFDLGAEWRPRFSTEFRGQPYAAVNLDFNGVNDFSPSIDFQAGWLWLAPDRRLGQFRVYLEFFAGHSPYGQYFQMPERFVGLGVALDH